MRYPIAPRARALYLPRSADAILLLPAGAEQRRNKNTPTEPNIDCMACTSG